MGNMTRFDAFEKIEPYLVRINNNTRAVSRKDAKALLGAEAFRRLPDGPTPETVYPWSVIDLLLEESQ